MSLAQTEREFTPEELIAAFEAGDPEAYISDRDNGWCVVDGLFNLRAIAHALYERRRTPAS